MENTTSSVPPAPPQPARSPWSHKALWLIGAGLLAHAAVMLYSSTTGRPPDLVLDRSAFAQPAGGAPLGARGIFMMPAQIGPQSYGLYLMDVDSGTICVYRTTAENAPRFRLIAARSFRYDRFLEDFNNDTPKPAEVQKLIESQRQRVDLQSKENQPTVDTTTKPDDNQSVTMPSTAPATGGGGR